MARDTEGTGTWRGGKVARPPRYGWKPGADARPRGRTGRYALILAALVTFAAFAYLIYLLTRPPRPYFVAIAADPADDALKLDAPLDLLGWRSAQHFLAGAERWTTASRAATTPSPLPAADDDETLTAWLGQFRHRKFDPVVMYFGVHAGTMRFGDGPPEAVLFAGRDKPVRVSQLVRAVGNGPLRDRRVVILLDPSRFRPDPLHGYQSDDFATALKALDSRVKEYRNLVLVSGADAGQRGWESEELGATAFAQSVIRSLDDPVGMKDVRNAGELFADVSGRLKVWTANNRQAVQSPFLLPSGDEGTSRAGAIRLSVRPPTPTTWDAAPVPSGEELAKWRELWAGRDARLKLAPHPAAYTPRAWRRYQELLLRHEAAMRAGLPSVAARLADASRAAAAELAPPFGAVFGAAGTFPASFGQALAFDAVRDTTAATDPSADLWKHAAADSASLPAEAGDPANRPSERHLAVMVNRFYRDVVKSGAPPDRWKDAIAVRVRADRAALGLPAAGVPLVPAPWTGPTAAFSERVWPRIRDTIAAADATRRDTEDRLFGPSAPKQTAAPATVYEAAAQTAAADRFALHVRDAAFAELPHLGRWAVASGSDAERVIGLWKKAHDLAAGLGVRDEKSDVAGDARAVWDGLAELRKRFDEAVRDQSGAALQSTWLPKEQLLATPLLPPEDRERLLIVSRQITFDLLTKPTGPAATNAAVTPAAPSNTTDALGRLFVAEVGLPANSTAARVADRYQQLAPLGGDERASRVAVAVEADPNPAEEPAAVAGRRAWADLFDALAARAVEDHWWDEVPGRGGSPYYRRIAERYHADAARLRRAAPVEEPRHDPLAIATPDGGRPLGWTSERRRTLGFTLRVPPTALRGVAVVIPRIEPGTGGPLQLTPATRSPSLVNLRSAPESLSLELESTSEDETPTRATTGARLYFRGQQPEATRTIDVNRRPELVITDPGPKTAAASVAVRADPTQPLPPVVILLDYSGSMKEALNGFKLTGPEDTWKEGASKFNLALRRLELVLAELPKGTPLRIRLFSARDLPDAVVYPMQGDPAVVDWQGTDNVKLRNLMARLRRHEPSGTTPLVDSIITAARNDFPERADGPKTLVVLTDGADDSGRPGFPKELRDGMRAGLKNTLAATGVKAVVVQFALNDADRAVSKEIFADLPALDVPGEVVSADDPDALRRELTAAIWPKLVLNGGTPGGPGKYPPGGWPARPPAPRRRGTALDGELDPNTLYWSPPLTAGTYTPRVAGYPDPPFSTRGFPSVGLSAGDFLSLSIARSATTFKLRRELQADAYGPPRKAYRGDGGWVLSVPTSGIEDERDRATYGALVLLERVPPHRRQPPQEGSENPVRHVPPGAVWWQVSPANSEPPTTTPVGWGETKTVISRLYGYPAPAWEIRGEGWPRKPDGDFEPATVRAWVTDTPPDSGTRFTAAADETVVAGNGRVFRVSIEAQAFAGAKEPMLCLVVRTEYDSGDPVQIRLATPVSGVREEHRYYRKANGYTALFGPWPPSPGAARANFEVVRVSSVTGDATTEIRLTPPPPDLGRRTDDYRPVPSRTGP